VRIVLFGALGEVGTHLSRALTERGHLVTAVSSRAHESAVGYSGALDVIAAGHVDLVVSASGRGDRRTVERTGLDTTRALARLTEPTGIPAILISTTRVLEGNTGLAHESDTGAATTEYANANLLNESEWLTLSGFTPRVLRLTNFFAEPLTPESGQASLLPWSLVRDAIETGHIAVKSDPEVTREFVDAESIARALETMSASIEECPPRIATAPGTVFTLSELCNCIRSAWVINSLDPPLVTFGSEVNAPARVEAQWLESMGWSCTLTSNTVTQAISSYLVNHDS